jgi:hypothetical protein
MAMMPGPGNLQEHDGVGLSRPTVRMNRANIFPFLFTSVHCVQFKPSGDVNLLCGQPGPNMRRYTVPAKFASRRLWINCVLLLRLLYKTAAGVQAFAYVSDATTPAKQCQVVNTETGVNTTACSSFSGTCQQTCLPLYVPTDTAVADVSCTTQSTATGFVAGNTNYGRLGVTTGNNYAVSIWAAFDSKVRGLEGSCCVSRF